jgi:hypothetical protein
MKRANLVFTSWPQSRPNDNGPPFQDLEGMFCIHRRNQQDIRKYDVYPHYGNQIVIKPASNDDVFLKHRLLN